MTERKCPKNPAKEFKLKTVKKGLDGNIGWFQKERMVLKCGKEKQLKCKKEEHMKKN